MRTHIFIYLIVLPLAIDSIGRSYDNYKVYNLVPRSKEQVEFLTDLSNEGDYDFWNGVYGISKDVRVMVSPANNEDFVQLVKSYRLDSEMSISNLQELIDAQKKPAQNVTRSDTLGSFTWDRYHELHVIYNWLEEIQELYPNIVTVSDIGTSIEGRSIKLVKIDFKPDQRGDSPLIGVIEGGIHCNEWITHATVTWIIKEFLTSNDPEVRALAEGFIWYILPVVNPDGYVYTFTNDRLWRKNRNPANFVNCSDGIDDNSNGVDLNRNFDFYWMTEGTTDDACHVFFGGTAPFSEPETRAVSNFILQLKEQSKIIYYLSFHSFTQLILLPHGNVMGYDKLNVENFADLYEISIRSVDRLKQRYGTEYTVGTPPELLYAVSGSSYDWAKAEGIPISVAFELRDIGYYGFLLPPEQIIPNNEEIIDSLVEMDKVTRRLGYYEYSGANTISKSIILLFVVIGFRMIVN